jgi:hypothetical protein
MDMIMPTIMGPVAIVSRCWPRLEPDPDWEAAQPGLWRHLKVVGACVFIHIASIITRVPKVANMSLVGAVLTGAAGILRLYWILFAPVVRDAVRTIRLLADRAGAAPARCALQVSTACQGQGGAWQARDCIEHTGDGGAVCLTCVAHVIERRVAAAGAEEPVEGSTTRVLSCVIRPGACFVLLDESILSQLPLVASIRTEALLIHRQQWRPVETGNEATKECLIVATEACAARDGRWPASQCIEHDGTEGAICLACGAKNVAVRVDNDGATGPHILSCFLRPADCRIRMPVDVLDRMTLPTDVREKAKRRVDDQWRPTAVSASEVKEVSQALGGDVLFCPFCNQAIQRNKGCQVVSHTCRAKNDATVAQCYWCSERVVSHADWAEYDGHRWHYMTGPEGEFRCRGRRHRQGAQQSVAPRLANVMATAFDVAVVAVLLVLHLTLVITKVLK